MIDRAVHLTLTEHEAVWLKSLLEDNDWLRAPADAVIEKLGTALTNHHRRLGTLSDDDVLATLLAEVDRHALGRVRRTDTEGEVVHFDATMFEVVKCLEGLVIPAKSRSKGNPASMVPHSENSLRMRMRAALKRLGWTCTPLKPVRGKYGYQNSTLYSFRRVEPET